jgi:hypothetical protein
MQQYVSGLVLLNIMLSHPTANAPMRKPTTESVVVTLNEIAHGLYRPDQHFAQAGVRIPFRLERKELVPADRYVVIVLNATTPESDFASVAAGGVIFEDPAWAVFAAESIAQGRMRAVPLAANDKELWQRLPELERAVQQSTYSPENFFSPVTGFTSPSGPEFGLLEINGAQLLALRTRGIQSFGNPTPEFYELFKPPKLNH